MRRSHLSVDGRRYAAAAVLVVVGQRQVQQAGAGGQVDVLHVLHLRPTHRTQLKERKERKKKSIKHQVYFPIVSLCAVAQDKQEFTHFWLMRHKAVNPRGVKASYRERSKCDHNQTVQRVQETSSHQISWVREQLPPLKSSDQHLC